MRAKENQSVWTLSNGVKFFFYVHKTVAYALFYISGPIKLITFKRQFIHTKSAFA